MMHQTIRSGARPCPTTVTCTCASTGSRSATAIPSPWRLWISRCRRRAGGPPSGHPAAARRRPCAWSPASSRRPTGASSPARHRHAHLPTRHGPGVPVLCPLPAHERGEERAFGLEMRSVPKPEIERRVKEALAMVRLEALAERKPRELSGGQQQRVALATVIRPSILLLDEPLSNLDAKLRDDAQRDSRHPAEPRHHRSLRHPRSK